MRRATGASVGALRLPHRQRIRRALGAHAVSQTEPLTEGRLHNFSIRPGHSAFCRGYPKGLQRACDQSAKASTAIARAVVTIYQRTQERQKQLDEQPTTNSTATSLSASFCFMTVIPNVFKLAGRNSLSPILGSASACILLCTRDYDYPKISSSVWPTTDNTYFGCGVFLAQSIWPPPAGTELC